LRMLARKVDSKSAPMSISELSKVSGFSKSTIHHYLKLGLLPPPNKTRANLHVYNATHLKWLRRIQQMKETGNLSLTELKELLDKGLLTSDDASAPQTASSPDVQQMETDVLDLQQAKRLHIIDKSIALFSKFGYEAVKVSDITDALQMGKGTFYLYFKNKRELLLACFDRLYSLILPLEMWDVVRNEKDIFLKLRHRWSGGNEKYSSFSGVLSLIRTSCFWDDEEVKENARRAYDVIIAPIRKDLEVAIASGKIRAMDAELASYAVLGVMEGLSFRLTLDSRYSNKEGADFIYPFLMSALTADKPCEAVEKVVEGARMTVTDMNGTAIELSGTLFSNSPYLTGKLGDAEIKVDPLLLSTIAVSSADSKRIALLSAKNGQEISLEIDGDTIIEGDTPFGSLQIPFAKVSEISFHANET